MRSLLCLITSVSAACWSSSPAPKPVANAAPPEDPAMLAACVPDWSAPPVFCPKGEDDQWILPEDDPANMVILQVTELKKNYRSESLDRAIVKLMTRAIERPEATECGKRVCRWHRALAYHGLGRWRAAFLDFASMVKDGPNNPFYDVVGEWITLLEPHVPREAMMNCRASYDPGLIEKPPSE